MVDHKHITVSKALVALNSASTLAARVVNFVAMLWVYQYLLRHLTAEEFAVLPVVMALMVFAPLFFSFMTSGIARYAIDAYAKGDFEDVRKIVSSIFPVLAGVAALFVTFGMVFALNIEKVFNVAPAVVDEARLMMALLIVSFAVEMLILPFQTAFAIRQRYFEQNAWKAARDFLRAILIVSFLIAFGPNVLWVVVASFIVDMVLFAVLLTRSLQLVAELRVEWRLFDFARARTLMNFGVWTTVGRLGAIMFTNAATLLLNLFGTPVGVTSYHIGATFFRQIQSTINLATLPLQPAMTAMNALDDRRRLASTVMRGGRYGLWASMFVATPLAIYADTFIELYLGPDYAVAATIIVLFMVMFPILHPTVLLAQTAMAMARVRDFFLPAFLFPLVGLIVTIALIHWAGIGAVGVTAMLLVTVVVSQVGYFWWLLLRLVDAPFARFRRAVLVRGLTPALIGGLVMVALKLTVAPESWVSLIACSGVGCLAYLAALLGLATTPDERRDLGKLQSRFGLGGQRAP